MPPFVAVANPDFWVVKNSGGHRLALWMLGFHGFPFIGPMSVRYRRPLDFPAMGRLATRLRDRGFAFSAGREWSPAEVVAFLRDEGHFEGHYTEIYWGNGDGWNLRAH
jgi:hypothetical protein